MEQNVCILSCPLSLLIHDDATPQTSMLSLYYSPFVSYLFHLSLQLSLILIICFQSYRAENSDAKTKIEATIKKILKLPEFMTLEYKRHAVSGNKRVGREGGQVGRVGFRNNAPNPGGRPYVNKGGGEILSRFIQLYAYNVCVCSTFYLSIYLSIYLS